jgi:hypothetical protein
MTKGRRRGKLHLALSPFFLAVSLPDLGFRFRFRFRFGISPCAEVCVCVCVCVCV